MKASASALLISSLIVVELSTVGSGQPVGEFRAPVAIRVENRVVRYARGVDGEAIVLRGQRFIIVLSLVNPLPLGSSHAVATAAAENDWRDRLSLVLMKGGSREQRTFISNIDCNSDRSTDRALDTIAHGGAVRLAPGRRLEERCQVDPDLVARLPAGRYTVEAGWNEAKIAGSPLLRGSMHTFVSMVQVEVRDLEEVSDVLEFNLHEMEYAYFDDRLAEAVEYADRALTIQPHSVLGLLTRAHALAKLGRCQEARANLVGAARAIESHLDVNDRSDRDGPERRRGRAREISTLDLPCR